MASRSTSRFDHLQKSLWILALVCTNTLAAAATNFTIDQPRPGLLVQDAVTVQVTATGAIELRAVRATLGTASADLTGSGNRWTGTLLVANEARGMRAIDLAATDALGVVTHDTVQVSIDRPPALTVSSPENNQTVSSDVAVVASCTDDDPSGCARIRVLIGGTEIASQAGGALNASVPLSMIASAGTVMVVEGVDSAGQVAQRSISVAADVVVGSPRLSIFARAKGATIRDFDGHRLLTYDTVVDSAGQVTNATLAIEPVGGVPAVVYSRSTSFNVTAASLTVHGALFQIDGQVYEAVDGRVTPLTVAEFRVAGDYSAWVVPAIDSATYTVRNDRTGQRWDGAQGGSYTAMVLAPNGDLIFQPNYASGHPLVRFRDGVFTQLASFYRGVELYQDGTNVAYVMTTTGSPANQLILLGPGSSSETLCNQQFYGCPRPILSAGWTLYGNVAGTNGEPPKTDAWLRSPAGEKSKISIFTASTTLANVNERGDALIVSSGQLYLVVNGHAPENISFAAGASSWHDGHWYFVLGRTVFVLEGEGPDGGGGSASLVDASLVDASLVDASLPDAAATSPRDGSTIEDSGLVVADGSPEQGPWRDAGAPLDVGAAVSMDGRAPDRSSDARFDSSAAPSRPDADARDAACETGRCLGYPDASTQEPPLGDDSGCAIATGRRRGAKGWALGFLAGCLAAVTRKRRRRD